MFKSMMMTATVVCAMNCSLTAAFADQKRIAPQASAIALFKEIYGSYPDSEKPDAWHKADKAWLGSGDISNLPGWETLPLSRDTAALNKLVTEKLGKDGEVCIDYDLISDSQDPNIARYRIVAPSTQSMGPAEYQIYIQGTSRKEIVKLAYVLVEEEGKWRVDDIVTYSTDEKGRAVRSAAKEMLKACLKD